MRIAQISKSPTFLLRNIPSLVLLRNILSFVLYETLSQVIRRSLRECLRRRGKVWFRRKDAGTTIWRILTPCNMMPLA